MSKTRIAILVVVAIVIAIQFIPVDRSNPPIQGEIEAPPTVSDVLRASCYDCHSNETQWPWYSHLAPVSWVLAHHVHEGREHLNFSEWSTYRESERSKIIDEIWDEVSEGNMPLQSYSIMHREARLSDEELDVIRSWAGSSDEGDASD